MAPQAESTTRQVPTASRATVEWLPIDCERLRVSRALSAPYDEVQQLLRLRPDEVLRFAYGADADGAGVSVVLTLHPSVRWPRIAVEVESFSPVEGADHGAISIRWTPKRLARVVPTMDADLVVHPRGHEGSELVLEGRYRPPLGVAGLVVNRLVGRFVAASTAKTFLDRVADGVEAR